MPYFKELSKNTVISKRLLNILSSLPVSAFSNNLAYEYLKQKVSSEDKQFPS
jgi:hypothetical protein